MRYALVICDDESDQRGLTELADDPVHISWLDYIDRSEATLLSGVRLRSSTDTTQVRSRQGQTLVTDGPFTETKEQIAGFALIECADLDVAIEIASRHPFARHGLVEIRPVRDE